MLDKVYKKIKKQNGEKFAQILRNHHNGLLEIEGIDKVVRHAGRSAEDARGLLPYLMSLLAANDDPAPEPVIEDPFVLLDRAGYDAFYADTLEKQNSIASHFKSGELLCTFNDRARYKNYYIIHAVKKDVDSILRQDFNGKEKRQDAYGTSVISIQIYKEGGFISIKNRYNHTVSGCDNTFDSNPDNIIEGLSESLKKHFDVEFSATDSPLPEGFVLINDQIFKYHTENNNIYYGDQAWVKDGVIHEADKAAGDAVFERFIFRNKTKTLEKIDTNFYDSFLADFHRDYADENGDGGDRGLHIRKGNLMLGDHVLIGAENSRIKRLDLPRLTKMSDYCLAHTAPDLTMFNAPALTEMGHNCLHGASALTGFNALALTTMGDGCFFRARALTTFNAPTLTKIGSLCLRFASALTEFNAPQLKEYPHYLEKFKKSKAVVRTVKGLKPR